jgi:hypothetical protein
LTITPTAQSSLLAGFVLWLVGWATFFKLDKVPVVGKFVNVENAVDWIMKNKVLTLLMGEVFNFGFHGVSDPASTLFAIGGTIFNVIFIFIGLPARQVIKKRKVRKTVLQGAAA